MSMTQLQQEGWQNNDSLHLRGTKIMQSLDLLPLMAMVVVFLLTTFCSPPYKSRNVKPLFSANARNRGENCSFALHRVIIKKNKQCSSHPLKVYFKTCQIPETIKIVPYMQKGLEFVF